MHHRGQHLIPKKSDDGTHKHMFCTDFKGLNLVTSIPVYPIPDIKNNLSLMAGSKYFTLHDTIHIGTYPLGKKTKIRLVS